VLLGNRVLAVLSGERKDASEWTVGSWRLLGVAQAWAGQLDLLEAAADHVRDASLAARRAAVVAAVQRLFPSVAGAASSDSGMGIA
jgi:hypothetical protein